MHRVDGVYSAVCLRSYTTQTLHTYAHGFLTNIMNRKASAQIAAALLLKKICITYICEFTHVCSCVM